jgi:Tfp pilus assembly protein PilF
MLDDARKLGTADELSAQAIASLPKHAHVLGTRGAVLIEKGESVEGQKLVQRALRAHREPFPRASNLACLAIAATREGRTRDAEQLLKRARRMDAECEILPRAERELTAMRQVSTTGQGDVTPPAARAR